MTGIAFTNSVPGQFGPGWIERKLGLIKAWALMNKMQGSYRLAGQLKEIVDEINSVQKMLKIKSPEMYATGISSGAATLAGLLACYPKMFTAAVAHSGPSYGLAQNLEEAEKVLKHGPFKEGPITAPCDPSQFSGSLMVIHGTSDNVVHPKNATRWMKDFIGAAEGKPVEDGETLVKTTDYLTADGRLGRVVMIGGLAHAWSGFKENLTYKLPTTIPFFEDRGPSATNLSWDFFQKGRRSPAKAGQP